MKPDTRLKFQSTGYLKGLMHTERGGRVDRMLKTCARRGIELRV
jgi:hypothetical protein